MAKSSLGLQSVVDRGWFTFDKLAKRKLRKVADFVVEQSPVYTGAYILSHTISDSRTKTYRTEAASLRAPVDRYKKGQNGKFILYGNKGIEEQARARLYADIEKLNVRKFRNVFIVNAALGTSNEHHASEVELRHKVYAKVRKKYG